ncbi:MAG: hypothetical protein HY807_00370 [Nitrospirae bacterium]|nr:hypothetical protein [Nitrospirota bacterium]
MIKLLYFMVLSVVFISSPLSVMAQQATEYVSPDGHLKATVISFAEKNNGIHVEIKKINGEIISKNDFRSYSGGELRTEEVAWTANSQYLIISNSDLDNPKIFPIYYYDSILNEFWQLPEYASAPHFELIDPDIIKINRLTIKVSETQEYKFETEVAEIQLGNLPKPILRLRGKLSYNNYTFKIFIDDEDEKGYLEIIQNEKTVFKQDGYKFRFDHVYTDDVMKKFGVIVIGKDITGRGEPNLVINEWSGGAHCCYTFHVFEIGQKFKKIATLDAGHNGLSHFEDLRGDKKLVFVTNDWTFAYWNTSFAGSPAPDIILEFKNGKYILATDLMLKQPPTQETLADKVKMIRENYSWKNGNPPVELWSYMLELIYSGNANVAWQFFDKAWLPDIAGKKEFMQEFQTQLETSAYWTQIKEMNK